MAWRPGWWNDSEGKRERRRENRKDGHAGLKMVLDGLGCQYPTCLVFELPQCFPHLSPVCEENASEPSRRSAGPLLDGIVGTTQRGLRIRLGSALIQSMANLIGARKQLNHYRYRSYR